MVGKGKYRRPKYCCRRPRQGDGYPCKKPVPEYGRSCNFHHGLPRIGDGQRGPLFIQGYNERKPKLKSSPKPKPVRAAKPTASPRTPRQRSRTRPAARIPQQTAPRSRPAEVIIADVPPQALRYVRQPDWNRVIARAGGNGCDILATAARKILQAKQAMHRLIGELAAGGLSGPEAELARQLASRIPLGVDDLPVAVARGLQLAGLVACVGNGIPLSRCACYRDIVAHEVKPMVNRLLAAGSEDWQGLGELASAET